MKYGGAGGEREGRAKLIRNAIWILEPVEVDGIIGSQRPAVLKRLTV